MSYFNADTITCVFFFVFLNFSGCSLQCRDKGRLSVTATQGFQIYDSYSSSYSYSYSYICIYIYIYNYMYIPPSLQGCLVLTFSTFSPPTFLRDCPRMEQACGRNRSLARKQQEKRGIDVELQINNPRLCAATASPAQDPQVVATEHTRHNNVYVKKQDNSYTKNTYTEITQEGRGGRRNNNIQRLTITSTHKNMNTTVTRS